MSDRFGSITISSEAPAPEPKKLEKPVSKRPVPRKKKNSPNRKGLLFAVIAFFCVASYFLAGTYLTPLAIQKYLPGYIENKTGLTLSIEKVRFNPFNFHLNFEDVKTDIPDSMDKAPLLRIKTLFIDLDLTALIRNTFVCDKLTIQDLQLSLIRHKDKSYNLPVLSKLSTAQKQGEIIGFAKLPFLFSLNNIDINDSRIIFTDTLTDKTHNIEKLQLAIPTLSNFSFQSKNYIQPHFSAVINGSPIQLSGEAVQLTENQGFQTKLSCSIESLDLVPYFSYLPTTFPLTLSKGRADTTLQISFAPNKKLGGRLQIDIKMNASDIAMKGKNSNLQITVPAIKMDAVFMPLAKRFHIKSIITKRTNLTGSQEQISSTLQNLFLRIQKKKNSHSILQIDQLLSDEGRITLIADKNKKTGNSEWNNLQLSIRNFHSKNTTGTIHLNGEQTKGQGSFSWQGHFTDTGALQGKLLLKEFPAFTLFNQFTPVPDKSIQGSATFTGDITFPSRQDATFTYEIDNGIVKFHDLKLNQEKNTWLEAESVRFTRLSRIEGRYNLGNIFLKNTILSLTHNELPPLFNHLFSGEERPQIKGIDFSGNIRIKSEASQKKTLELSKVSFQANKLEKTSTIENFAFSGEIGVRGIVKAKGILNIAPTQLQLNIAFSEMDSTLLAPFFSKWPLLRNSKATFHGKGALRFPSPSFQGNLRLTNTLLQNTPETPLLNWQFAEFHKLSCNFSPFSLEAESLTIDSPQFQWQRNNSSPFQHLQTGLYTLLQKKKKDNKVFPIIIKKVNFKNGSVNIIDKRLTPAWASSLKNLEGHINNFNTTSSGLSSFTLSGTTEEAPLSLSGAVTLFSNKPDARAKVQLTNYPLASLDKQLQSMPIKTENAALNLNMNMTENQAGFSSKNEMLIKNIKPASMTSDTALALAFLTDSHRAFPLNIRIDNGSRPLLKESVASFQTTTIKASYAPLLLDRRFKDLHDKELVPFRPGSNQIENSGLETLARYANLLESHPALGLIITGMADETIDRNAIHTLLKQEEQQRVNTANEKGLSKFREKQKAARATNPGKTLQEEDIAKEELAGFVPLQPKPVKVANKVLLDLAKERSLLVVDAFIHSLGIAQDRISTSVSKKEHTNNTPSNGVRITIKAIATDVN